MPPRFSRDGQTKWPHPSLIDEFIKFWNTGMDANRMASKYGVHLTTIQTRVSDLRRKGYDLSFRDIHGNFLNKDDKRIKANRDVQRSFYHDPVDHSKDRWKSGTKLIPNKNSIDLHSHELRKKG